jgi:hypothetical protein
MTQSAIPDRKALREFGFVSAALVVGLFGLLLPWLFDHGWPRWPWLVGASLATWAAVHPSSLFLLYRPWMKFGEVMGWINSRILLGLVFYLLITPTGLARRLFGQSAIRNTEVNTASYRVPSRTPPKEHMERPY